MASRLKLIVAYDGGPFAGWQSQANGNTIQDRLEKAFALITRAKLRVHGAGRTDAGVHALAQCAHVDLTERNLTAEQWTAALNGSLPRTIRVLRCRYVGAAFHARFDAKGKTYRYRIWNDRVLPPLELGRAWHVPMPLDLEAMMSEARALIGRHDFAGFAANRGKPEKETTRTVEALQIRRAGRCITLEVTGDGFLYKMVRLMVGALVQHARGRAPAGLIRERLQHPKAAFQTGKIVAPAEGLYLVRVRY
jgi:tRNA pseudouridine38-40 synthase